VHGWNDGLVANPEGEVHVVIIPVPVSVMEKVGTYRFVLHFYDDYADSYKNHQIKATLEVNQKHQILAFAILVTSADESFRLYLGRIAYRFLRIMCYGTYEHEGAISGLQVNLTGRYAIRSLNRLCHLDQNRPEAKKKAKKHAVWVFYGHANPYIVGFGYYVDEEHKRYKHRGAIANYHEDHDEEYYNIHMWPGKEGTKIGFVRLAFLHGCATAGGKSKLWRWDPVPENQSIAASFNKEGAETVVGWKDSQYSGLVFSVFNGNFWRSLRDGMSVAEAVKRAKKIAEATGRFFALSEETEAIGKVVIFGNGGLKLLQRS